MAKSKKSKILASMLAVSTMAVFYAAPVMAGDGSIQAGTNVGGIKITIDREDFGQDGTADSGNYMYYHYDGALGSQSKVSGQLFISSENIAEALKGQNVTFGAVTADTISAASGAFEVNSEGIVDAASFNATTGDITTNKYSLNTVGAGLATVEEKTAAMYHTTVNGQHLTTISGKVVAGGVTMQNGNITTTGTLVAREVANSSGVTLSNLDNAVDTLNTSVAGVTTDITDLQNKTQNMSAGSKYTTFRGSLSTEGSISSGNGAVQLRGNWRQEAAIDLRDTNNNYATLTATQLANINNVVQENGNVVANSLNVANGAFEVTNDGTVNGPGKFTIYNNGVMYAPDGGTIGGVTFNNDGSVAGTHFSIAADGEITATNFNAGSYNLVEVGNDLTALQGTVDGTTADITALEQKTAGISKTGPVTTVEGVVSVDGQRGLVNFSTGNGNGVLINSSQGQIIANSVGANQIVGENLSGGNGAFRVSENGEIVMQKGEGSFKVAENGDILMNNGVNGEAISFTNGGLNLTTVGNGTGMITLDNGTVKLMGNGTSTVTINEKGTTFGTLMSSETTTISGGTVTASNDFVTTNADGSEKYTLNTIGDSLGALQGDFDTTNANVAGIKRFGEGAPGEGITTIEGDALFVSKDVTYMSSGDAMVQTSIDSAYMSFGDNMISVNKGGINLTGSVGFTGHDGGRYTLSDLEGRVYDLEQKTQGIDYDEETGTTTVDGDLNVKGDAATGEGGNLNAGSGNFDKVATDEVTVGDKTYINGDSVNSVNGNFENITADKGTIGGVTMEDGTVSADKVVTGNTTLDNEGLNVGGNTSVTSEGVNVGGAEGTSIKHDEISVGDGGYIGGGDVVSGNGVSLNDTAERVGQLENHVGELEDRIDKVGAMAAAIANLRTMGYDPAAPTEVAVGIGQYRDETGAALGLFHYPNRDFMLSLSVSTSGDEVMGGIGATWKFGRKSPEKVAEIKKAQAEADARRAEEAKLAKAEEMKQAAKEAKIKAQQERHAKLAAERAAQAEAAK